MHNFQFQHSDSNKFFSAQRIQYAVQWFPSASHKKTPLRTENNKLQNERREKNSVKMWKFNIYPLKPRLLLIFGDAVAAAEFSVDNVKSEMGKWEAKSVLNGD